VKAKCNKENKQHPIKTISFVYFFYLACLQKCFMDDVLSIGVFTITAEIHARSLVNFYRQYADRHMNLKFM